MLALHLLMGCSSGGYAGVPDGATQATPADAALPDLVASDMTGADDLRPPADMTARPDMATSADMAGGPITGGPCTSGSRGATALRVRWTNSGGRAMVNYEVHGLPDKTRWKVSVYGRVIGFEPQFVDIPLGGGGVLLDSSDFIDIELSTGGVTSITSVTLSLFGRSLSTGTSGGFEWITRTGGGATARDYVSNVAPYRWYPADATGDIDPNDKGILMRVLAGGSSGTLVVSRLELCIEAS